MLKLENHNSRLTAGLQLTTRLDAERTIFYYCFRLRNNIHDYLATYKWGLHEFPRELAERVGLLSVPLNPRYSHEGAATDFLYYVLWVNGYCRPVHSNINLAWMAFVLPMVQRALRQAEYTRTLWVLLSNTSLIHKNTYKMSSIFKTFGKTTSETSTVLRTSVHFVKRSDNARGLLYGW